MEASAPSPTGQDDLLSQAQRAILKGDRDLGRRMLTRLLEQDRCNETAWLWLSSVVTSDRERRKCLRNVLRINGQNQAAVAQLRRLERGPEARGRISRHQNPTQRTQILVAGGILALALFFGGLAVLMMVGDRLTGQPIALVPLYTRPPVAAQPTALPPTPSFTDTPPAAAPVSTPEPATVTYSTPTLAPEVEQAALETAAEIATEALGESRPAAPAFAVPVRGRVSVGFSRVHPAFDFEASIGAPVVASASGRVIFAGRSSRGYGNLVVVRHASGWESWYAHLERFSVDVGDWICRACPLGTVGNTGASSGPHLHFEIREGCSFYDLFTGERLSSGVAVNFRYDPFGAPICLAEVTALPLSAQPTAESSAPKGEVTGAEGGQSLSDATSFSP